MIDLLIGGGALLVTAKIGVVVLAVAAIGVIATQASKIPRRVNV